MDRSSERSHQVTYVKGFRNKVHLQTWEVITGRSSSNWSSLSDINQECGFNQVTEISSRYQYFTGIWSEENKVIKVKTWRNITEVSHSWTRQYIECQHWSGGIDLYFTEIFRRFTEELLLFKDSINSLLID